MPTEAPAYTLLVSVAGQPLAADIAGLLAGGYVDNSLNVPDLFVLYFSDNGTVIDKAHIEMGAAVQVSVQPTGAGEPKTLLNGEITAIETEIDHAGKHLIVRGFDKSHRFFHGTRIAAYVNVKASDIAQQLAQQSSLQAGTMTTKGTVLDHVIQPGISDWDFLCDLAAGIGAEVSVVDGTLNFQDPVDASGASGSDDSTQNPLTIEFGRNLLSLRATVTAADQVPSVDVRGWDPKTKQVVVGSQDARTRSATLSEVQPTSLASTFSAPKWTESNTTLATQQQAQDRADALVDRLSGSFAELDGIANGNPDLKAGKAVTLSNVGKPFDGKYTLTSTRHDVTAEFGYRVLFTVSNSSDRSLYGVSTGAGAANRPGPLIDGAVSAIVTDIKDPDSQGRVKVKIPVLADDLETGWCRVVQVGAGPTHGVVWLPEVGDEVLVVFGMGHVDEPYVLGGLFNGNDKPDKEWSEHVDSSGGTVQRRALVSRTGMFLELIESSSDELVNIKAGDQTVTVKQNGDKSIEINAGGGPVHVTAQQNVEVTSSSGDVKVKGTSVSIEATSSLDLKGATVTLKGDGSAELSSSGTTTVKGSMVQIN